MSSPHADRDHSEQPTHPEAFVELLPPDVGHNLRHLGPERAHVTGEECHCSPERIPHAEPGTSRGESAREVRASEAQVEAARLVLHDLAGLQFALPQVARAVADAVVAAGDADEVTRLRAEAERLRMSPWSETDRGLNALIARRWREDRDRAETAEAERDEIAGRLSALLCELTGGRLSKTTYDVRTMVQEIDSVYDDAQREERAERERLRAEVERIRDLAERGVAAEARAVHDLEAEVERLQAIVSAAALETYTPDGSERFVAQFWEVLRRAKAAEAKVVRVKRLMENREAERPFKTVTAAGVPFPTLVTVDEIRAALSGPTPAETPHDGPEPALSREQGTSGQSGEAGALGGAENGLWRARCDVPGCGWRSWPYKARVGADTAGHEHWLSKGHGTSIGVDR